LVPLTVIKANTATTLTSSLNPSEVTQPVTFTASVLTVAPGSGTPDGTVTFMDTTSGTTLGTISLSGGTASLGVSNLAFGSHAITASYSGSSSFASSSGTLAQPQQVNKIPTNTALSFSANPATLGQPETVSAVVTATFGARTPTGSVTFTDGNTTLGTVSLSGGTATLSTSALAVGAHAITATYNGDAATYLPSSGKGTLNVTYKVVPEYSQTMPVKSGTSLPVKVELANLSGTNLSSSKITLTVVGLTPSPKPGAAPSGNFTFMPTSDVGPMYQLNIKTTGYPVGTYALSFTVSGDPVVHTVAFVID
jgi:hypothetical protein